jgi:hypothetical protein
LVHYRIDHRRNFDNPYLDDHMLALIFYIKVGLATEFARPEHDSSNPSAHLACLGRELNEKRDIVIAHQTLPCGQRVNVCVPRTGKCVVAVVGDRGPVHALVDLAPATARRLGFNGYEPVVISTWLSPIEYLRTQRIRKPTS